MHLSKNSRYVLQKAQFLPTFDFLKGVEKNLSVKIPKDDPTKPALRVNIPEDHPRSQSIGPNPQTPPVKSAFQESLLQTSENEIQFSKYSVDDILADNCLSPKSQPETVRLSSQDAGTPEDMEQIDCHDALQSVLQEAIAPDPLGNSYFATADIESSNSGLQGEQNMGNLTPEHEIDPENLYIIIDVPGNVEEKRLRTTDLVKENNSSLLHDKNYSFLRGVGKNLEKKSKSLPRFSTFKRTTPKHMRSSLEVHELDESTYVFHLKLNKTQGGVLCVPERDLTTRPGDDKTDKMEGSLTVGSGHPLRKQVTVVEDRPEAINYDGQSTKYYKADGFRSLHEQETATKDEDGKDLSMSDEQGKKRGKEDKVACNAFVEDDFRSIRNGIKTYPFKMPSKRNGKKKDGEYIHEEPEDETEYIDGPITTNDWWKKDPMEEAKISYEIDMGKVKPELITTPKEKNEPVETSKNEPPLPPSSQQPQQQPLPQQPQKQPVTKKKERPTSPYFNITDVISDNPDYTIMNRNLSDTMYDTKEQFYQHQQQQQSPDSKSKNLYRSDINDENAPKYFNIEEVIPEEKRHTMRRITDRRKKSKKPKQLNKSKRLSPQGDFRKAARDGSDFHTAANCFSIACEGGSNAFLPFGSAFPPLLGEALKNRFKFRKELLLTDRWNSFEGGLKEKTQNDCSLGENSILFPEKHSVDLECDNLFIDRDEIVANLIKCSDTQPSSKIETVAAATVPPVDPLTMMKKVKEIVQFDLNNAVKIFDDGGVNLDKEVSSVVMVKGEGAWEVDRQELNRYIEIRKNEMLLETAIRSQKNEMNLETVVPSSENEMKLETVVPSSENEMKLETANPSPGSEMKSETVVPPSQNEMKSETANPSRGSEMMSEAVVPPSQNEMKSETKIPSPENEMKSETTIRSPQDNSADRTGNKTENESQMPLYLPSKTENTEMKLLDESPDSVVMFDSETNKFSIRKEALAKAISKRTSETFGEVLNTLNILAEENVMEAKNGDSILVYDVDTKSWKVDFSILEKRRQQQQIEEELTKRSEAILETFERFEKEQFNSVPKPNSPDKKTFDYEKEEWKAYNSGKKNMTKSKLPFKKSNAEEIRKKNSDMYENLFDGKKKVAANNDSSSDPSKESKLCSAKQRDPPAASTPKGTATPAQPVKSGTKTPLGKGKPHKEDDHFWETFLRIHIPPKPSKGPLMEPLKSPVTPKPKEPVRQTREPLKQPKEPVKQPKEPVKQPKEPLKQPKEPLNPPNTPPAQNVTNIPDTGKLEKPVVPPQKIEEPKFRIHLPFIKDKKNDKPKVDSPTKGDKKMEEKMPPPSPNAKVEKKEEPPKVKAPPPPSSTTSKGDPPKGVPNKPIPTIGSSSNQTNLDVPSSKNPNVSTPTSNPSLKIQDPKPPGGKNDKMASEHYVSDKIIELTRSKNADHHSKVKANKIETVKLNITSDTRMPSKITEINLGKKPEEKVKELTVTKKNPVEVSAPKSNVPVPQIPKGDSRKLDKHLESFKTSYSDPDFEEKLMKIKPDLESNPNLKKLDNWSKTLVLHDIMKPPENLETWLKDETDKMATLLLKVLQEAGDAKTKKKHTKAKDKHLGKGVDRKKQKNTSDNYFFRVQTMNLALGSDKKLKSEDAKLVGKAESLKDLSEQPKKLADSTTTLSTVKAPSVPSPSGDGSSEYNRAKRSQAAFGPQPDSLAYRDLANQIRFPMDITDDVPGPEILKKISNAWRMVPVLGSQLTVFSLHRLFQLVNLGTSFMGGSKFNGSRSQAFVKLFNKYGPIVNVQGPLSGNVIFIHKPEHLSAVFDQDAPLRSVFDSLEQSRKDLEERSSPTAISTDWNKPEWNELRRGTNDPITKGWEMYFGCTKTAADSLVYVIRRSRNAQDLVSEDFMHEIKRWSLEGMCQVLFEKSFGYLEGRVNNDSWILEPEKLYMAMDDATTYLNKCERGFQSWRLFTTPSLAGLCDSYRSISSVILKQLNQAEINLKNKNEILRNGSLIASMDLTFIESMLLNDGLTPDEMICNLADTMVIGTSIMNSALGFFLYNLAQNVPAQKKLFNELKEILPSKNSQLDYYKLSSLKYLQACLKESLRLHPPIPVFYRLLQNDILVSNYIIPKGSYVVMDCAFFSMKEQNFEESHKFVPERWLDECKSANNPHPLAPFPFCHGPRGELIKKVVEMQLSTGIAKILRNFSIEYHYEDIQGTDTFISFPDKPLKLSFVEREC